jgi:hypothetical protein
MSHHTRRFLHSTEPVPQRGRDALSRDIAGAWPGLHLACGGALAPVQALQIEIGGALCQSAACGQNTELFEVIGREVRQPQQSQHNVQSESTGALEDSLIVRGGVSS